MIEYELHSYKDAWVIETVRHASETIAHQITDTAIVERRAMIQVGQYLSKSEHNKTNRRYIRRLIYREINAALKRNRREHAEHFADLSFNNEEGQAVEYEPIDVLANVESGLILKETIALLAQNDRRNEMILNAWANGETNDTEISRGLASTLGGKATGHLSHIKKFKIECRTELTAQAI